MAALPAKGADGYLVHPAVLQAAVARPSPSGGSSRSSQECQLPATVSCAALPLRWAPIAATTWGGCAAALHPGAGAGPAAALGEVQCKAAQQLCPQLAAEAQAADLSQVVYTVEWQAAEPAPQAQLALALAAPCRRRGPALAAACRREHLALSQAATLAAAAAVQVLHQHRTTPQKTVTLHTAGSLPALACAHAERPAIEAAAVAGVLKSLPYELPFLSSQLLDTDAAWQQAERGRRRAYALSAAPLPPPLAADLYGTAARAGRLYRPQLTYQQPSGDSSQAVQAGVRADGTYLVTGGLGGLGLLTAQWMAGSGARSLLLASRSGLAGSAADAAQLVGSLALISITKCDASVPEDARLALAVAQALPWRLAGAVHAAGLQASSRAIAAACAWPGSREQAAHPALPAPHACRWRRGCPSRRCARCARSLRPSWGPCRPAQTPPQLPPWTSPSSSPRCPAWPGSATTPTMSPPTPPWTRWRSSRARLARAAWRCSGAPGRLWVSRQCTAQSGCAAWSADRWGLKLNWPQLYLTIRGAAPPPRRHGAQQTQHWAAAGGGHGHAHQRDWPGSHGRCAGREARAGGGGGCRPAVVLAHAAGWRASGAAAVRCAGPQARQAGGAARAAGGARHWGSTQQRRRRCGRATGCDGS